MTFLKVTNIYFICFKLYFIFIDSFVTNTSTNFAVIGHVYKNYKTMCEQNYTKFRTNTKVLV